MIWNFNYIIMISPEIAIIINSFNRVKLLKECLAILSSWVPESEFNDRLIAIIYDAGSTDGSREWMKSEGRKLNLPIHVIFPNFDDDTSFASGLNSGAAFAERKWPNIRYFLFYETDNKILNPAPISEALIQLKNRDSLAACGFTVRKHNGNPAGVGMAFPTLLNFVLGKHLVHRLRLEKIPYRWDNSLAGIDFSEVDVVFTSPLLVKVNAWKESNGLDSKVFPFSDCDIDWARRLRNLGWRMGVIRSNYVIHDNKENISTWSKSRAMQFHRARLRYFMRYKPFAVYFIWPAFLFLRHLIELSVSRITVKESARSGHMSLEFLNLLKASLRKYE